MITVKVNSESLQQTTAAIAELSHDASPLLSAAGSVILNVTKGNFTSFGSKYRPEPWPHKRSGQPSNLTKTGTLRRSFSLQIGPTSVTLSSPTIYAALHQFGGIVRAKNAKALRFKSGNKWFVKSKVVIPARPFIPITPTGQLTEPVNKLVVSACERTLKRLLSHGKV